MRAISRNVLASDSSRRPLNPKRIFVSGRAVRPRALLSLRRAFALAAALGVCFSFGAVSAPGQTARRAGSASSRGESVPALAGDNAPDRIVESVPDETQTSESEFLLAPPDEPTPEMRAQIETIHTDLGPVCRLKGDSFETGPSARTNKKEGALELTGPGAEARAVFDLPDTEDFAVSLVGRGLGALTLDLDGTEIHIPALGETGSGARRVAYAATESLFGAGNSLSIRAASGGVLESVVFSRPLAKLRQLAGRYASIEAQRRILSDALREERTAASASERAADPQLAKNQQILDEFLARFLSDWRAEYLAVYREYARVYANERPQPLLQKTVTLAERLNGVESQLAAIRGKHAPALPLEPDKYRIPIQDPLRRETFADYPWIALRLVQIDSGAESLSLLKALGIDALMADLAVAGDARILERFEDAGMWCILSRDVPFRPEWNRGRDFDPDRPSRQPLPDLWRSQYLTEFEAYVAETYRILAERPAVLGFSYWPDARLDATPLDAQPGRGYPALQGAWEFFRLNALTDLGAPGPAAPVPDSSPTTATRSSSPSPVGVGLSSLGEELAWNRFLEETLAEHFRCFNRSVAAAAGNKPRLGLFASPSLGPGQTASRTGLDGYELLANTGFPAFGTVMRGDAFRMAYAESVSRFDPAGRPIWESLYRLDAPSSPTLVEDSQSARARLRRDFWRMAFWGVDGAALDAGPDGAELFEGPSEAGLAREPILEIPALKRRLAMLSQAVKKSRVATQQIALLEPNLDGQRATGSPYGAFDPWLKWFRRQRYAPLWIPRGILAQDEPATPTAKSLFDEYRILASPGTLVLSETAANQLLRWVKGGGILFTSDPVGYVSPDGRIMPLFLDALGGSGVVAGAPGHWAIRRDAALPAAVQILSADASGAPNAFLVPVGKGNLLVALGDMPGTEAWGQLMSRTASFVFDVPALRASVGADELELLLRENDKGERFLLALNPDASRTVSAQIEVRGKYASIVDLTHNRPVRARFEALKNGATRLTMQIDPCEARILRLESAPHAVSPSR